MFITFTYVASGSRPVKWTAQKNWTGGRASRLPTHGKPPATSLDQSRDVPGLVPQGVILGLVPRTQPSGDWTFEVRIAPANSAIDGASRQLGPRDKPEDDN